MSSPDYRQLRRVLLPFFSFLLPFYKLHSIQIPDKRQDQNKSHRRRTQYYSYKKLHTMPIIYNTRMSTAPKSIHFMGIGGSGMSAVAQIAAFLGYQVTGCD